MYTPQELELLALAQAERQRNSVPNQPQAPQMTRTAASQIPSGGPLPDLTPDMLLSASAQREVEAAKVMFGYEQAAVRATNTIRERQQAPQMSAREYRASQGTVEMTLSEDMGDIDLDSEGQAPQVTGNDDMLLSSLFMGREAQDAQAALGGGGYAASGYDIEYDTDSMIEGRGSPNESARWQVGRQSPPRSSFSNRMEGGPSDGVVVSSRRASGGWERSASAHPRPEPRPEPQPNNIPPGIAAIRQAAMGTRPAPQHARPIPSRAVPPPAQIHRPTVYEHIMRGGFLDDD